MSGWHQVFESMIRRRGGANLRSGGLKMEWFRVGGRVNTSGRHMSTTRRRFQNGEAGAVGSKRADLTR